MARRRAPRGPGWFWLGWGVGGCGAVLLITQAGATWKPEYAQADPNLQDWYQRVELTAAARLRFGFKSCCAHSDVVKTRFRPTKDGADGWEYLDGKRSLDR